MNIKTFCSFAFFLLFSSTHIFGASTGTEYSSLHTSELSFLENKGQLADSKGKSLSDIKYYGTSGAVNIYCMPGKIRFVFFRRIEGPQPANVSDPAARFHPRLKRKALTYTMDMELEGAATNAEISGAEEKHSRFNYYSHNS